MKPSDYGAGWRKFVDFVTTTVPATDTTTEACIDVQTTASMEGREIQGLKCE